jgi:hypothetical protein
VSVNELPNAAKEELAEALGEITKAAGKWKKCLMCEIDGVGRFDLTATKFAEGAFRRALATVEEITGDEVAPRGLLEPLMDVDGPALTRRR